MIPFPNLDPEIFSVTVFGFHLALRWYALAYIFGLLFAWRMMYVIAGRPILWGAAHSPIDPKTIEDLITYSVFGIIVGGRLGYVLFYQPAYYLENPAEIIAVWQGGMSFHGGFLGVVTGAFLFFRKHKIPLLRGADLIAVATPMGLFLGRIANFINAELWGRPTDMPWGVIFPGEAAQSCGQIVGLCARHPSQLYEAGLEGLVLGLVLAYLVFMRTALAKPGLIMGLFFAGYGLSRAFVELFRQPDAQFQTVLNPMGYAVQIGAAGLTMGQILSLPMILIGVFFVHRSLRRGTA